MSGERTVSIKFTGEASGLDKAATAASGKLDNVAESTDKLATKTGTATGALGALAGGAELVGLGKYATILTTVAVATDVVSGSSDLLTIALESARVKQIGATIATVAHSVAQKAAAVASGIWSAAQWALNVALSANPIGLIVLGIAALIAIVVLIATKTTWFQDIWRVAWGGIKAGAEAVVSWFSGVPGKIGGFFSSLSATITAPFRAAFNRISDLWNGTVGRLQFHVPGWVPGIGGNSFSLPTLPHLARGGPALAGRDYLVGENGPEILRMGGQSGSVIPNNKLGGDTLVTVYIGDQELRGIVRTEVRETNRATRRGVVANAGAR